MKKPSFKRIMIALGIALFAAVVMILLQNIPPFSLAYKWLDQSGLKSVWWGITAGLIAAGVTIFLKK